MENDEELKQKNPAKLKIKIIVGIFLLIFFIIVGLLNYMNEGSSVSVSINSDSFKATKITDLDYIYTYKAQKKHETNSLYFLLNLDSGDSIIMNINIYTTGDFFELEESEEGEPKIPSFDGIENNFSKTINFEAENEKTSYSKEEIDEMANKYKYDLNMIFEQSKTIIVHINLEEKFEISKFSFMFESVK